MIFTRLMNTSQKTPVCLVVENMTVPTDRRVWAEARALRDAGYAVSVVCPKGKNFQSNYQIIDDIHIHRHGTIEATGAIGYLIEYTFAFLAEFYLVLKVFARTRFRVLQGCNPPDNIFLIGLMLKPFGVRYIFDHHDLSPELIDAKFGKTTGFFSAIAKRLERWSFQTADVCIATNTSFKEVAIQRGSKNPDRVFVVRNCPDLGAIESVRGRNQKREVSQLKVVYVGFMGKQDGLDLLLEAIGYLVHVKKRVDAKFVLVGGGTMLSELRTLAVQKGLDAYVTFTGQVRHDEVLQHLADADIGVAPDPKTAMNDRSTMIKIFEYMAFGLPVVLFDLKEGRRSAGAAALYARPNQPIDFANQISTLLDSKDLRMQLGVAGRKRIEDGLNWNSEKEIYLEAYRTVMRGHAATVPSPKAMADSKALLKPQA